MAAITSLAGCSAKVQRAELHFKDFDARALDFIERVKPYRTRVEIDDYVSDGAKRGAVILTEDAIQPPSDEWGPIVGDYAHNLMSALDHLVCQLSIANGGEEDCQHTEFPIFAYDAEETQAQIRRRIGSLFSSDQRIIRNLQPFHNGAAANRHPLWLLRTLNTIDKHRRLHLVRSAVYSHDINVQEMRGFFLDELHEMNGVSAGDAILRFRVVQTGAENPRGQVTLAIRTGISFAKGSGDLEGLSVRSTLPAISAFVRSEVFGAFEHRVGRLVWSWP